MSRIIETRRRYGATFSMEGGPRSATERRALVRAATKCLTAAGGWGHEVRGAPLSDEKWDGSFWTPRDLEKLAVAGERYLIVSHQRTHDRDLLDFDVEVQF